MTSLAKRAVHARTRKLAERFARAAGLLKMTYEGPGTEPTREHWLRAQEITQSDYDAAPGGRMSD